MKAMNVKSNLIHGRIAIKALMISSMCTGVNDDMESSSGLCILNSSSSHFFSNKINFNQDKNIAESRIPTCNTLRTSQAEES